VTKVLWVILLISCEGYRAVPSVGMGYDPQTGNQFYSTGITYAPPFRLSIDDRMALSKAPVIPAFPPTVVDTDHSDELEAVGAWPWWVWVCLPFVLLAGASGVWVWRRKLPEVKP